MLTKILIVVVLIILLRNHLGIVKWLWPECVGLATGGMIGWWWVSATMELGTSYAIFEYVGCPRCLIKPIFALVGALLMVGPVSVAIRGLFPPNQKNEQK